MSGKKIGYFGGFLIMTGGLAWGAHALGLSAQWIGIGSVVLVGAGIMSAASMSKSKQADAA